MIDTTLVYICLRVSIPPVRQDLTFMAILPPWRQKAVTSGSSIPRLLTITSPEFTDVAITLISISLALGIGLETFPHKEGFLAHLVLAIIVHRSLLVVNPAILGLDYGAYTDCNGSF